MSKKKAVLTYGSTAVISLAAGWGLHRPVSSMVSGDTPAMPAIQIPAVTAVQTKEELIKPAAEYIAVVEPVQRVGVRTEVPGYIEKVHFTEGALVNEGDLLFTIDPSQYKAAVGVRRAELARAEAELNRAEKYYKRVMTADKRSVSQVDIDTAESDLFSARAAIQQAEANLNLAQIDLNYTEVRAPVKGRIGVAIFTKGNYVTSSSGSLANIVQFDPVRVTFSMTDREYLAFLRADLAGQGHLRTATVRLPDGTMAPGEGKKDFDDNAMNPSTGTIAIRYQFNNQDGLLVPDGYVTAVLHNPNDEKGIMIPQRAIMTGVDGMFVFLVDADGGVSSAPVTAGKAIEGRVVITSGLKAGDRVIVDGLQKTGPGGTVKVSLIEGK
ncbi:MAG: efflux RND transporter periplasmic adaptor subunit [Kiritimatiellales bacterium]